MHRNLWPYFVSCCSVALLASACGGGGGGTADAAPPDAALPVNLIPSSVQLTLEEGSDTGESFTLRLSGPPGRSLDLTLVSSDESAVIATPTTLRFDDTNFAAAQIVTITALEDDDPDGESVTLTFSAEGVFAPAVMVDVIDLTPPIATDLFVRGSFNDFGLDTPLTFQGNRRYTAKNDFEPGLSRFKIADASFSEQYTFSVDGSQEIEIVLDTPTPLRQVREDESSTSFESLEPAAYRFTFLVEDLTAPVLTLTREEPAEFAPLSLRPLFQLTPEAELARFHSQGVSMSAEDFTSPATVVSVAAKLDEIGAQIGAERGSGPLDLIPDPESRERAESMPFRGKASDIGLGSIDDHSKAFVPLGGTFGIPGNEVAVVNLTSSPPRLTRIQVGIRPQRVAVHERSGLVFVCNQFSNYVSVIDGRDEVLLERDGKPVVIATDFYCSDLVLVEGDPELGQPEGLFLYIANIWRGSVLKYAIEIIGEGTSGDASWRPVDVVTSSAPGAPVGEPLVEITGVGRSPARLHVGLRVDDDAARLLLYVASRRGGDLALIDVATDQVERRISLGAPLADVIQIDDQVYATTTTPFRGLLRSTVSEVAAPPVVLAGLDGETHQVHPGALLDQTDSYGFEDVRNGIFQIQADLSGTPRYLTDFNEADRAFGAVEKVLAGAVPQAIVRDPTSTSVYVALSGSDVVQELELGFFGSGVRLRPSGRMFYTREIPVALAFDDGVLLSVGRGSEVLEVFDSTSEYARITFNLGYAQPSYPATTIEAGEYFFHTARFSNDEMKACTSCHFDEGITDGLGFSAGALAPTALHQVKPVWNLQTTEPYGWNGSSAHGSQAGLAFDAMTRTNCELVAYGLVEGPSSDPGLRIGDPWNFTADGFSDARCRPNTAVVDSAGLPASRQGGSFVETIAPVIAHQRDIAGDRIADSVRSQLQRADLPVSREAVVRALDFYTASELRLPPNPLSELRAMGRLDPVMELRLERGEALFRGQAGCAGCHDPDDARRPFTDGRSHGQGSDWIRRFVETYAHDPWLLDILPNGILGEMLLTAGLPYSLEDVGYHHELVDFFIPFCFDQTLCLSFRDPLQVRGTPEEDARLFRIALFHLSHPDRGFVPGQVVEATRVNTPSLRGLWFLHGLLHNGHATSVREAVLAPGHPALAPGEVGLAVNREGSFDVHGQTTSLSTRQVEDLSIYLQSIE